MKFRFTLEGRCATPSFRTVRWLIIIIVVIFLVPSYEWGELITSPLH
ncbi:hypothetical protein ACWEOG_19680 [Amycolatopsis japonica]|nr:hypothetical protein [Amycolatopsis sp. MJM2582]